MEWCISQRAQSSILCSEPPGCFSLSFHCWRKLLVCKQIQANYYTEYVAVNFALFSAVVRRIHGWEWNHCKGVSLHIFSGSFMLNVPKDHRELGWFLDIIRVPHVLKITSPSTKYLSSSGAVTTLPEHVLLKPLLIWTKTGWPMLEQNSY